MRLFLGLPVPARHAQALARRARATGLTDVRWTPADNMHLTLVFLGEVPEDKLPSVVREVRALKSAPLQLRLTRLGTFSRAGVLFAEAEPNPELLQLQAQAAAAMARCGFPPEQRSYQPHITLARFRKPVRLSPDQVALPPELGQAFGVGEVNLYRSHVGPDGSRYEVLAQKKLGT